MAFLVSRMTQRELKFYGLHCCPFTAFSRVHQSLFKNTPSSKSISGTWYSFLASLRWTYSSKDLIELIHRRKVTPALCHWLGKPAEMYMQSITQQARAAAGLITVADMEMVEIRLISQ